MKGLKVFLLAALVSAPAQAEIVRFNFEGIVTGLTGSDAALNSYFGLPVDPDFNAAQTSIAGFFEYETDLLPIYTSANDSGYSPGDFDIAINGVWVQSEHVAPDLGDGIVSVVRDASHDTFAFDGRENIFIDGIGIGFQQIRLGMWLYLPPGTFVDTGLPTDSDFFSWPLNGFASGIGFTDPEGLDVYYSFTPLRLWVEGTQRPVSAPAGGVIFAASMLALSFARRRGASR